MTLLVWLDYETTGLDPARHCLLEMAVALATLDDPFNFQHAYHAVFRLSAFGRSKLDPFIVDMHTKNGLLDECARSTIDVWDAEWLLRDIIPKVEDPSERPILAGSTISFDKAFMAKHMPMLHARFSHRLFDVSGLKLFCQSRGMPKIPKGEAHRAKKDVVESIAHGVICDGWLEEYYYRRKLAPFAG